jgi:hypothetical protein
MYILANFYTIYMQTKLEFYLLTVLTIESSPPCRRIMDTSRYHCGWPESFFVVGCRRCDLPPNMFHFWSIASCLLRTGTYILLPTYILLYKKLHRKYNFLSLLRYLYFIV